MKENTNWWEPIFSGQLEIGLDKEKLQDVEAETFLYYGQQNNDTEARQ